MSRADRLFDLIQILRDGRLHRAADLAARQGVSDRTIWRDMATLAASGLPVEGERGVGYILRAPITLPPMMLTSTELEALRLGLRLVAEGGDPALAAAARSLATKMASVTPAPADTEADALFARPGREAARAAPHLPALRRAIRMHERISITYIDPEGRESHRDIRPLALETLGKVWSLAAFCEGRGAFRSFRVDRIQAVTPTGERFPDEPGRRLADYRAQAGSEAGSEVSADPVAPAPETRNSGPAGS